MEKLKSILTVHFPSVSSPIGEGGFTRDTALYFAECLEKERAHFFKAISVTGEGGETIGMFSQEHEKSLRRIENLRRVVLPPPDSQCATTFAMDGEADPMGLPGEDLVHHLVELVNTLRCHVEGNGETGKSRAGSDSSGDAPALIGRLFRDLDASLFPLRVSTDSSVTAEEKMGEKDLDLISARACVLAWLIHSGVFPAALEVARGVLGLLLHQETESHKPLFNVIPYMRERHS